MPLISIAHPNNDEVVHHFNEVSIERTLHENDEYSFVIEMEYEANKGK